MLKLSVKQSTSTIQTFLEIAEACSDDGTVRRQFDINGTGQMEEGNAMSRNLKKADAFLSNSLANLLPC